LVIPEPCYGCSAFTAAEGCYRIKDLSPGKLSGYYWVKPACGMT